MKKLLLVFLGFLFFIVIIFLITLDNEKEIENKNISSLYLKGNYNLTYNSTAYLNISGFLVMSPNPRNCSIIKGKFIIKKMSTGTERNISGILDDAIQMTSYEGDFYKHPEFNMTESYVSYARMIASEGFLNESKCNKIYLGTRIEEEITKRRFWFDKKEWVLSPIVSYVCIEELNEVEYCGI